MDRKIISCIQDLHEEREAFGRVIRKRGAEDGGAFVSPEVVQGLASRRTVLDGDVFVFAVDQFPGFSVVRAVRESASVDGLKAAASPDLLFIDWVKDDGFRPRYPFHG